jgi:hypothetical protein
MTKRMKTRSAARIAALLLAFVAAAPSRSAAQTFSEPATVFYGKVVGTGSAQDFPITEGALRWTIQRSDGSTVTFGTSLYELKDGDLSYRLDVPHAALALGLSSVSSGVPLPPVPETHLHLLVTVDGEPASLLGPAGSSFTTEQLLRTSTYRMDLALGRKALDSDGDGIPDYWEDKYGLDKQDPNDAGTDLSGDGLSALAAYLRGLNPRVDSRAPALLTKEILVYRNGATGILLDTADANSTPAQLTYTLTAVPLAGALVLRQPPAADRTLGVGATFTQADLLSGRVVFQHGGGEADPGFFALQVRDENPANPAASGHVQLLAFAPPAAVLENLSGAEAQRMRNAQLAAAGHVILDGSAIQQPIALGTPSTGQTQANDRPYVLVGGAAGQRLSGGSGRDVMSPAAGDATLAGGPEADLHVFRHFATGVVTVSDFTPSQGDVLDLSSLPSAPGAFVHQYLRASNVSGTSSLQVDLDGNGVGFTNLVVALPGLSPAQADIYRLIADGHLRVGDLRLEPRVTVAASQSQASENGPTPGQFTFTREGSLLGDLSVNVVLSGAAQNGVDYQFLPSVVLMPEGVSSVQVAVTPNEDSVVEPAENVQVVLAAGSGYRIGATNQATVTIEDRLMLVRIEALEPVAAKESGTPGVFLITRSGVLDRDVLVRLTLSGTAANGTDYNTISSFVQMGVNQTTALIQVVPKATAVISGGFETVKLSIRTDAAYRVTGTGLAEVALVERLDQFAAWRGREFPADTTDLAAFAVGDSGAKGISHLERYAFGLSAQTPDPADLPRAAWVNSEFVFSFRKPVWVTDVTYRVKAAGDLTDWAAHALVAEPMPAPAGSTDPQRVYYRIPGGAAAGFIAVEVEYTP